MSIMVERVPDRAPYENLEGIRSQAREIRPGRTLAVVFAAVFYAVGWTTRGFVKVLAVLFGGLWYGMAFAGVSIREGWRQGQAPADRT